MNIDNIKKLLTLFHNTSYIDMFGALLLNEKIDYLDEMEEINDGDIEYLEELYEKFMDSDMSLLNPELLEEINE